MHPNNFIAYQINKQENIMTIIRPFKAIRPTPSLADKVISLPYDVMNREEATKMAQDNSMSFLHICRSEIDLPDQNNPYDESVYLKARDNIKQFLEDGIFLQDDEPTFYFYRQTMGQNTQTGIVGCVSVDDYLNDIIKKHEYTREEKEQDRIRHFDICNANTEPVFLTYRANEQLGQLTDRYIASHDSEFNIITNDGVGHIFWVIRDNNVKDMIVEIFKSISALYIADGHHRSASACKVGLKRREANPNYTGDEEFNYFMAVIFPDKDLNIYDYNRVVRDLNGHTTEAFLEAIEAAGFSVEKKGDKIYQPTKKHTIGMFLDGTWYALTAEPKILSDHPIDGLDVAILQKHLLAPILGIEDPRTDKRIDFVGGIRGLSELEKRVGADMTVAFALFPVTISDLLAVSDNGMVMPPKSTWFEPKLGSGLFVHQL
jgi:uncharacterized protein (DUF1015 family)